MVSLKYKNKLKEEKCFSSKWDDCWFLTVGSWLPFQLQICNFNCKSHSKVIENSPTSSHILFLFFDFLFMFFFFFFFFFFFILTYLWMNNTVKVIWNLLPCSQGVYQIPKNQLDFRTSFLLIEVYISYIGVVHGKKKMSKPPTPWNTQNSQ